MSLAAFGVRKPVVANLVMLALIGAGIVFGLGLRREFFPEIRPTQIQVTAPYPGAAPEEVEKSLAKKIEDRVADLDDVEEIETIVREGSASIAITFYDGTDIDLALFEVKRVVDSLQDLPDDAERIVVSKFEPNIPVCVLSIAGDIDERILKDAMNEIRDDLRSLPGMGDLVVSGLRTDEITVEAEPDRLLEHRLSLPALAGAISEAMAELPAGTVRSSTSDTSIRTIGADDRAADVRRIVVKAGSEGQIVRVEDVASVTSGFEDLDLRTRLNGQPSASVTIFKIGNQDAVEIAEMVKAYAAGRLDEPLELTVSERVAAALRRPGDETPVSPRLEAYELGRSKVAPPPGDLVITTDLARFIVGRLNLLTRNALAGGVLVLLTLIVLLNLRVAFWVAVGLGVSLFGTLAAMAFIDISLNFLSMFGLIIVVGLLVDDAIVVAENITARHEDGEPADEAAIRGTGQVLWPVVATVLTTICAFLPLALVEGEIGDFMKAVPVVVACALGVSLIEALFILPSHMAHSLHGADRRRSAGASLLSRLEARLDAARDRALRRYLVPAYLVLLRAALRARYLTLACAISVLVVSLGLVAGGRVPFTFLSSSDAETVNVEVRLPIGSTTAQTDAIVRRVERAALAQPEVSSAATTIGMIMSLEGEGSGAQQSHVGQVVLELLPIERRDRSSEQIIEAVRAELGALPGVESIRIEEVGGGPSGPDLSFAITGPSIERITPVVEAVKERMRAYDGVRDIADDADDGKRELRITLLDGSRELGLTTESVAAQIRGAVFGLEAHTFPGDREDVDVRVLLPPDVRRSLGAIEQLHVFTPDGTPVALREVARLEEARSYASIRRLDRDRAVTVNADVAAGVNTEQISGGLASELRELEGLHPGVRILERGRQKENAESLGSLPRGMLVALGLIYVILAWLFGSYTQPIVVLLAVPFAVIGMIWGHFLLGFDMTILSLIGFIALSGVVVNDSLIFIDFYNQSRTAGHGVFDALLDTGRARLRPILLTTITTSLGLLPLMLEQSFQARFLIPMAITISCGLLAATGIILVVLPCVLLISSDLGRLGRWVWSGGATALGRPPSTVGGAEMS